MQNITAEIKTTLDVPSDIIQFIENLKAQSKEKNEDFNKNIEAHLAGLQNQIVQIRQYLQQHETPTPMYHSPHQHHHILGETKKQYIKPKHHKNNNSKTRSQKMKRLYQK